jgi:hypothetical protein
MHSTKMKGRKLPRLRFCLLLLEVDPDIRSGPKDHIVGCLSLRSKNWERLLDSAFGGACMPAG